MINLTKLLQYLNKHELTAEEHLFLLNVDNRNTDDSYDELLDEVRKYYGRFGFYQTEDKLIPVSWKDITNSLIKRGFLIAHPGYIRAKPNGGTVVDFSRLETTDKFRDSIYDSDREKWWEEFVSIYGSVMYIQGNPVSTLLPEKGETTEDIKKKFWRLCGNGSMQDIGKLIFTTQEYVEVIGNNLKITRYLDSYDACMKTLEEEKKRRDRSSSWIKGI